MNDSTYTLDMDTAKKEPSKVFLTGIFSSKYNAFSPLLVVLVQSCCARKRVLGPKHIFSVKKSSFIKLMSADTMTFQGEFGSSPEFALS